jgi:hypothetical protein
LRLDHSILAIEAESLRPGSSDPAEVEKAAMRLELEGAMKEAPD